MNRCAKATSRASVLGWLCTGLFILVAPAGLSWAALAGAALAAVGGTQATVTDDGTLQDIVVTARKRAEKLIDAPVAVQALGGEDLTRSATTDLAGLSSQIPQLNITKFPTGGGAIIQIRGIGSPADNPGIEDTVSTVFDGVQLSRGLITSLGFFDVNNVQVLKGPQALYFGKNSPAGVVSVTSNGPSDQWEGYAREGYEFNAVEPFVEAAYGGPLSDTFKVRVAAKYDQQRGYLTNDAQAISVPNVLALTPGAPAGFFPATVPLQGAPSGHWPTDRSLLGRIVVEWTPAENFTAALHALGAHVHNDGAGPGLVTKCAGGPNARSLELGIPNPTGSCEPGTRVSVYSNPLYFAQSFPFSSEGHPFTDFAGTLDSLELNYTAGPMVVTSMTGYAYYRSGYLDNLDGQFGYFAAADQQIYGQGSEELRLTSHLELPVNFVTGVLYEKSRLNTSHAVFLGAGLFPPDPVTGRYDTEDTQATNRGTTISPFAQLLFRITTTLELDAGARYTRETHEGTQFSTFDNAFSLVPTRLLPPNQVLSGSHHFSNVSPEATLTWHESEETMFYAAYKTGYKSGGYSVGQVLYGVPGITQNNTFLFQPEKSSGGEIGAKARLLGDTIQITGAIYDYEFRDLQESIFSSTELAYSIQNAGAAKTRGAESEITWRVDQDLTLTAALSYNRGRFTRYPAAACWTGETAPTCSTANPGQNLAGTRLPYSSDWVEKVGFYWSRPLPISDGYRFSLASHIQYLSNQNVSATGNPTADVGPQYLMDANLGVYPNSESWKIELTGRNLLNKHYLLATIDKPGGSVGNGASDIEGTEIRPREIWIRVSQKF